MAPSKQAKNGRGTKREFSQRGLSGFFGGSKTAEAEAGGGDAAAAAAAPAQAETAAPAQEETKEAALQLPIRGEDAAAKSSGQESAATGERAADEAEQPSKSTGLTDDLRKRIEENRQRALENKNAKRARAAAGQEEAVESGKTQTSPENSKAKAPAAPPKGSSGTLFGSPSPSAKAGAAKAKAKAKAKQRGAPPPATSPVKADGLEGAGSTKKDVQTTPEKTDPPPQDRRASPRPPQYATPPRTRAPAGPGGRFARKNCEEWLQYNHVYTRRLSQLRGAVVEEAHALWGGMVGPDDFKADITGYRHGTTQREVVLVGLLFRQLLDRPNVIEQYSMALGKPVESIPAGTKLCTDADTFWLEDGSMRVQLVVPAERAASLATGFVVAVRGAATPEGAFRTSALCFARMPSPATIPAPADMADAADPFVAFVSGLGFGSSDAESSKLSAARELLVEYLTRPHDAEAEDAKPPGPVKRLIVCGGGLPGGGAGGSLKAALTEADTFFSRIAGSIPTELMPGRGEPTNMSMPQMPLHPHLFRKVKELGAAAFRSVSNPYECSLAGLSLVGHSGQPVQDLMQCAKFGSPLDALVTCLEARHLAPTAPDTLATQPFVDADPFVLESVPHLLFSGGHPKAEERWQPSPRGDRGTSCVCVPAFHCQPAVVLVNLRNPKDVRVHEFHPAE